jgi:hypothetical protein
MRMPPNKRHSQHIDPGEMGCLAAISRRMFLQTLPERLRAASNSLLARMADNADPVAVHATTFNDRSAVCSSAGWR